MHVSFTKNTAQRYGRAIYSYSSDNHMIQNVKPYVYIYHQGYIDHCTVYNLSATTVPPARAGDQLYGGKFLYCPGNVFDVYAQIAVVYLMLLKMQHQYIRSH